MKSALSRCGATCSTHMSHKETFLCRFIQLHNAMYEGHVLALHQARSSYFRYETLLLQHPRWNWWVWNSFHEPCKWYFAVVWMQNKWLLILLIKTRALLEGQVGIRCTVCMQCFHSPSQISLTTASITRNKHMHCCAKLLSHLHFFTFSL